MPSLPIGMNEHEPWAMSHEPCTMRIECIRWEKKPKPTKGQLVGYLYLLNVLCWCVCVYVFLWESWIIPNIHIQCKDSTESIRITTKTIEIELQIARDCMKSVNWSFKYFAINLWIYHPISKNQILIFRNGIQQSG